MGALSGRSGVVNRCQCREAGFDLQRAELAKARMRESARETMERRGNMHERRLACKAFFHGDRALAARWSCRMIHAAIAHGVDGNARSNLPPHGPERETSRRELGAAVASGVGRRESRAWLLGYPIAGTLPQCDPFGIPSMSHWTGAVIIVQAPPTKTCIVTGPKTSRGPMPSSLAG